MTIKKLTLIALSFFGTTSILQAQIEESVIEETPGEIVFFTTHKKLPIAVPMTPQISSGFTEDF